MKIQFLLLLVITNLSFAQSNTDEDFGFTIYNEGQAFTAITVDQDNNVWAGTDKKGVFYLNQEQTNSSFVTTTELGTVKIESMASDNLGNVWVGHSGINYYNGAGGLDRISISNQVSQHYSPDRDAQGFAFFERDGIATLYVKDVTVDHNGTVWLAQWRHQLTSGATYILTPGTISYKYVENEKFTSLSTWNDRVNGQQSPELPYPAYTYNPTPSQTPQARNCNVISSDSSQVWVGVFPYTTKDSEEYLPTRVLAYDLSGLFLKQYMLSDVGFPEGSGVFNGIYRNNSKGTWVTASVPDKGFSVFKDGIWKRMNPEVDSIKRILPPNTRFNDHAIWGNEYGNVFMGTNNGLLVYDGKGPVDYISSYTLYSKSKVIDDLYKPYMIVDENMTSNNIIAGCSENENGDQWIATDNGIMKGVFGGVKNPLSDVWIVPSPSGLGFLVYTNNEWKYMSPSADSVQKIIPPNTLFNNNAFWGNDYGNVFMGSNNGLLVYDGRSPADRISSYTFYSNTTQMPASPFEVVDDKILENNITGGYSIGDSIQHIITDQIAFNFKVGFIKTNPKVRVCGEEWRRKTDFTAVNAPSQCLYSVSQSTSQAVRSVENKIAGAAATDPTYHLYQIDTKIGNPKDENGSIYTVEQIFELMKKNAAFQAITPYDFPTEVMGDNFLQDISKEDIKRFSQLVNTQTERINTIQEIMNMDPSLMHYDIFDRSLKAIAGFALTEPARPTTNYGIGNFPRPHPETLSSLDDFFQEQIAYNPIQSIHETAEYHLYSTPGAARTKRIFKSLYNVPLLGVKSSENCEGDGLVDVRYDPVVMHIDETNYTITNYTLEGHYFHPGKICRTVYRDDETGDIYVRTVGEGLHFCKGDLGIFSGNLNTIMGLILFKNVDLRLRNATRELSK